MQFIPPRFRQEIINKIYKSLNWGGAFIIGVIYYFRREQLKKITESIDKAKVENIEVFYSYGSTLLLVILIVFSAIFSFN